MQRKPILLAAGPWADRLADAVRESGLPLLRVDDPGRLASALCDPAAAAVLVDGRLLASRPDLVEILGRHEETGLPVAVLCPPGELPPPSCGRFPALAAGDEKAALAWIRTLVRLSGSLRELRRADERYRVLYESSPIPYQSLDPEARVLEVNDAWLDLLGYRREEVLGRHFAELVAPELLPRARDGFHRFRESGALHGAQYDLVRADGGRLSVEIDGRIAYDAEGRMVRTHCLLRDVTPQRRVQAALRSSEIRYRHLFESAPVSLWEEDFSELAAQLEELTRRGVTDIESYFKEHPDALVAAARSIRVLDVNQQTVELFEASGKKELLASIDRTFTEESFDVFRREVIALVRGEPGFSSEATVKTLRGRRLDVLISLTFPPPDATNKIALISMTDITTRKRVEETLLKSRFAIENAADGILWLTPDGRVEDANRAACVLLGYDRSELRRLDMARIDASIADWGQEWGKLAASGVVSRETTFLARSGARIPVEVVENLLEFRGRRFVCAFVRDRTEQRRLEAQLRQAQKLETIGRLAGGIAHDFNNILGPIVGCADMLMQDLPEGSEAHGEARQILQAAQRAKELVGQILLFSRRAEQERRQVQPHLVIGEVLSLLRSTAPSTIRIVEEIDANCGAVHADPTQLHQVVMNLCTNAIDAMAAEGGVMTVRLRRIPAAAPHQGEEGAPPAGQIAIEVEDTGPGIDDATREKIFEPFFTTKQAGSGLGLAVVHGIVSSHGGTIDVEAGREGGALFTVRLPACEAPAPAAAAENADERPLARRRVLYVEDQRDVARVVRRMLERMGHEVVWSRDGEQALSFFREDPMRIDFVITDQTMPSMTGLALAREMTRKRADLPVLLMTGYSEALTAEEARRAGVREIVKKPVSSAELSRAVRRALGEAIPHDS